MNTTAIILKYFQKRSILISGCYYFTLKADWIPMDLTQSERKKLYQSIKRNSDGDCWIWKNRCDESGNPVFRFRGQFTPVKSLLYRLYFRKSLKPVTELCLSCGNSRCVNPVHMQPKMHCNDCSSMAQQRPSTRSSETKSAS
jgi:hypothetical protein